MGYEKEGRRDGSNSCSETPFPEARVDALGIYLSKGRKRALLVLGERLGHDQQGDILPAYCACHTWMGMPS
jgi:hypothetical protein